MFKKLQVIYNFAKPYIYIFHQLLFSKQSVIERRICLQLTEP